MYSIWTCTKTGSPDLTTPFFIPGSQASDVLEPPVDHMLESLNFSISPVRKSRQQTQKLSNVLCHLWLARERELLMIASKTKRGTDKNFLETPNSLLIIPTARSMPQLNLLIFNAIIANERICGVAQKDIVLYLDIKLNFFFKS
jgi:hypothetical protein